MVLLEQQKVQYVIQIQIMNNLQIRLKIEQIQKRIKKLTKYPSIFNNNSTKIVLIEICNPKILKSKSNRQKTIEEKFLLQSEYLQLYQKLEQQINNKYLIQQKIKLLQQGLSNHKKEQKIIHSIRDLCMQQNCLVEQPTLKDCWKWIKEMLKQIIERKTIESKNFQILQKKQKQKYD